MDAVETIALIDGLSNINDCIAESSVDVVQSKPVSLEPIQTRITSGENTNDLDLNLKGNNPSILDENDDISISRNDFPESGEEEKVVIPGEQNDELDGAVSKDQSLMYSEMETLHGPESANADKGKVLELKDLNQDSIACADGAVNKPDQNVDINNPNSPKPFAISPCNILENDAKSSDTNSVDNENDSIQSAGSSNTDVIVEVSSNRATTVTEVVARESSKVTTPIFEVIDKETRNKATPICEVFDEVSNTKATPIHGDSSNIATPISEIIGDESSNRTSPISEVIYESGNRATPTSEVIGEQLSNRATPTSEVIGEQLSNRATPTSEVIGEQLSNRATPTSEVIGEQLSSRVTPNSEIMGVESSNRATPISEVIDEESCNQVTPLSNEVESSSNDRTAVQNDEEIGDSSSRNSNISETNEKQIYDETVSSTDNRNEENVQPAFKQNENIFDKLTGHFQNVKENDDSASRLNMTVEDTEGCSGIATDSEREATEDDIMNFSISQDESEGDTAALPGNKDRKVTDVSELDSNKPISSQETEQVAPDSNEPLRDVVSDVHLDSTSTSGHHAGQYNYLQKMSNVIKAIDSSKSTTTQKKDRDNIFSVLSAEISHETSISSVSQKVPETSSQERTTDATNGPVRQGPTNVDESSHLQTDNSMSHSEPHPSTSSADDPQNKQTVVDTSGDKGDNQQTNSMEETLIQSISVSRGSSEEPMEVTSPVNEGLSSVPSEGLPAAADVKQEPDLLCNNEESGDILDILKATTKTTSASSTTSGISVTVTNGQSSSSTVTVAGTFQPPGGIRIKEEPQDYFESSTNSGTNVTSTMPASSSLQQLSRQVNSLQQKPKSSNVARKSTTSRPPSQGKRPRFEMTCATQPSSQVAYSVPMSTIPNATFPNAFQQRPNMPPRHAIPSSSPGFTPLYPFSPVQVVQSTMNRPMTVNNNMKTVTIVSNGKTLTVPVTSVISVAKSSSQADNAKVTTLTSTKPTITDPLPKTSINIDTVGLNAITELIARKNPIPNYKPPPIPENLRSVIAEDKCKHICYECGDTFLFASSLKVHRSRTSMMLKYKCEECKGEKTFFNKCQFLGHLRNHLNIDKSQAVPIHIKSDSISITTLDHGLMTMLLKWIDDIDTKPESLPRKSQEEMQKVMGSETCTTANQESNDIKGKVIYKPQGRIESSGKRKEDGLQRCHECGGIFSDLKNHFGYYSNDGHRYSCNLCKKMMPAMCSGRAHRRIHDEKEPYVCPECGKSFSSLYVDEKQMSDPKEYFAYHVYYECFHTMRSLKIVCPKCDLDISTSFTDYQSHLGLKLEQYYKCQVCPMAFKQPNSFLKHFVTHKDYKNCKKSYKVIFRCHVCDSVMDDKTVLDMHIMKHVTEAKNKSRYEYLCRLCKNWFPSRQYMKKHMEEKHEAVMKKPNHKLREMLHCIECDKMFSNLYQTLKHETYPFHSQKKPASQVSSVKCRTCGILIFGKQGAEGGRHHCIHPDPNKFTGYTVIENPDQKHVDVSTVEESLVCALCSKVIATKRLLQSHLINHKMQGEIICQYCQDSCFRSHEEVDAHQDICPEKPATSKKKGGRKSSLPVIEYPCEACGYICFNKIDLAKHHKENHAETGINPCHLCSSTYESQEMLRKHIMATHEGKRTILNCHICQKRGIKKVFSSKDRLDKHLTMRHKHSKNRTNVESNSDSQMTPSPEAVKRKISESDESAPMKKLRVHGEAEFTCAKCPFSSNDKASFLSHLVQHKVDNCVQCLECGLSFAVLPTLRKHLFMVHKIKDFDNYCKENAIDDLPEAKMDDSEIRKGLLDESEQEKESSEHEESESSNPLECRVCYKVFDSENAVRSHLRTHGMAFIKNRRSKPRDRNSVSNETDVTA